jgi:hypothetical protein
VRVKSGDHAADGFLDQFLVVDRLDIKGFDRAEDIAELPQVFEWQGGARIALEESVYAAAETRRSQQIVLYAEPDAEAVRWAVSRVVAGGSDAPLIEGA